MDGQTLDVGAVGALRGGAMTSVTLTMRHSLTSHSRVLCVIHWFSVHSHIVRS
jgi:hypothetical protein